MRTRPGPHLRPEPPALGSRAGRIASRAPAAGVLALQQTAGNRAVGALLARAPTPKPAPAPAPETPKDHHVIVPKVGTIPLLSFQWGGSGRPDRGPSPAPREIVLSSEAGDHSSALARAAGATEPLGLVEIVLVKDGKVFGRIKLHNAVISSYSMGAGGLERGKPLETWTLDAERIEFDFPGAGSVAPDRDAGWDR